MNTKILIKTTDRSKKKIALGSPGVGVISRVIAEGTVVSGGELFGSLTILNRKYRIRLPNNISGIARIPEGKSTKFNTGYNDIVLIIEKTDKNILTVPGDQAEPKSSFNNGSVIRSFIDGIFYRRPSPDSPPFVSEGEHVSRGDTLGLVEVMKSFNRITFPDSLGYEKGILKRIFKEDGSEIASGELLFSIDPLTE